jgi:YHS domain-containing protein
MINLKERRKSMKIAKVLALAIALSVFLVVGVMAEEHEATKKAQTTCPVMGGKINKDIYADHEGKRVYFCCKGCVEQFKKGPAKYVKELEDEGVVLEKLQTTCPVMGNKVNKDIYADYEGKRVYFCCKGCVEQFKKEPAKYVKKLEDEGVMLEKTPKPQTACPVMGNKINKDIYTDYEGKRVYFCCSGCVEKFKKEPAKYLKKLKDEGITLEKTCKAQSTCPAASCGTSKDS